ncbi:Rha family transcriptional regulator [Desulfobacula sp.]|uniref:Rha family transcriptional regulator n=1 Tax=Desulfobacula sp. TaxID=2593537 RepID=UPI00262C2362|nr:Rha family transcriptional regulator [Desulfobacula sp.]
MTRDGFTTTSLKIAEVYGKDHSNIIKKILGLNCSEEFSRVNFNAANYLSKQGKMIPMYNITRTGFAFLVGKFSGKKAGLFMEQFIAVFNAMEKALMQPTVTSAPVVYQTDPALKQALVSMAEMQRHNDKNDENDKGKTRPGISRL